MTDGLQFNPETTEDDLRKRFPAAFNAARRPLKIGIHSDLGLAESDSAAMRAWCRHPEYLRNLLTGGGRIDLSGKAAGEVGPGERAFAYDALMFLKADLVRKDHRGRNYYYTDAKLTEDEQRELRRKMPKRPIGLPTCAGDKE
jgi:sRNA-binding protein